MLMAEVFGKLLKLAHRRASTKPQYRVIQGSYKKLEYGMYRINGKENGKENGNYYLGFRVSQN